MKNSLLVDQACLLLLCLAGRWFATVDCRDESADAKRLYGHLMAGYNRLVRPVSDTDVNVSIGLKLLQLTLNLKNQILSTNVWLEQRWFDRRLTWSPADYGNVNRLHLLPGKLYLPDIVLYNNADGNYEIRAASSKALVHSNGLVEWSPRVQLKSNCNIDLHLYPLDSQQCSLRFGTWTKGSPGINLQLTSSNQTIDHNKWHLKNGIDLSAFEGSAEYEIVAATAQVRRKRSTHYPQPYEELVFSVHLKRKSLLYTLHLVGPCMIISALSICVFHLPTRSKEKLTLSVTLLVILFIFSLVLAELVPTTDSPSVPLINRYLLFTLCQVTLSVLLCVLVIRVADRSPASCTQPGLISRFLLRHLSKLLNIRRADWPSTSQNSVRNPSTTNSTARSSISGFCSPACQSFVANSLQKYQLEVSPSDAELNSRLVHSRRSTGVEEEEEPNGLRSASTSSKSTNSSKRSISSSDSFERNKKESSPKADDDGAENPLRNSLQNSLPNNLQNRLQSRLPNNDPHSTKPGGPFEKAVYNLNLLERNARNERLHSKVQSDWQFLAVLLDRLFLWLSAFSCLVGWLFVLGYVLSFA